MKVDEIWERSPYKSLTHKMLNRHGTPEMDLRQYVVEKIKAPLLKAICVLGLRYPEPTIENTSHPNTKILMEVRDKFLEYEQNKARRGMFEALWRMLICEYEHDSYYRHRIDWVVEQIVNRASEWQPRPLLHPMHFWEEPRPFGGGHSIIK